MQGPTGRLPCDRALVESARTVPCRTRSPALPPPAFATGKHLPRIGAKSREPARSSSSNDTNAPARGGGGVTAQEHCERAAPTESRCLKRIFVARLRLDQFQPATRQPAQAYPGSAMHQALWRPREDLQDIPQRAFSTAFIVSPRKRLEWTSHSLWGSSRRRGPAGLRQPNRLPPEGPAGEGGPPVCEREFPACRLSLERDLDQGE